MPTTTRMGIRYPAGTDQADVPLRIQQAAEDVDASAAMFSMGPAASRPPSSAGTPGKQGRFYFALDTTKLWFDTGTGWIEIGPDSTPAGVISDYGGNIAPAGWLLCDGSTVLRATYPALFTAVGTSWASGGELGTEFRLPNLKGRVTVARDAAQPEFDTVGEPGGEKVHRLLAGEMPLHGHTVNSHSHGGVVTGAGTGIGIYGDGVHSHAAAGGSNFGVGYAQNGAVGTARGTVAGGNTYTENAGSHAHGVYDPGHAHGVYAESPGTNNAGSATPDHNNLQPYAVVHKIIKT